MNPFHLFLRIGVLLGLLSLAVACNAAEKPRTAVNNNDTMITHYIGRFMIEVPQSMKIAHRSARLRHRELEEVKWPSSLPHEKASESAWQARLDQIRKMPSPKGKPSVLIEQREISKPQPWIRAIRYFGDNDVEEINWDTLVDAGITGLWIKSRGMVEYSEEMLGHDTDIARAYHPIYPATFLPKENVFYLEHGFIALPYVSQEEAYARFEGHPLELKLRVETTEIHKDEAPDTGLIARTAAAIASGFASGVEIKKIRSEKRKLAGLDGEEEVVSATAQGKTQLDFGWRFAGRKESGEYPKIRIRMETPDGQLDEKLKLWDALLNSFKPVGQ